MKIYRWSGVAACVALVSGCYTLDPAGGVTPEIGKEIAFDINDVGRVGLGASMGPEIAQVEGTLMSRENAEYLVAVRTIHLLRGGEQIWKGETVRIKPEYVGSTYERHFSRGRSLTLGAVGVASLVYLVTRSVVGGGTEDPVTPPGSGSSLRVP